MPARITATDEVHITATPAAVYRVLVDFERYAEWWPPTVRASAVSVTPQVEGSELEIQPRGGPAFRCRVEQALPGQLLALRYLSGPYEGVGIWTLKPVDGGTLARYSIDLTSEHRLLRFLARFTNLGRSHSRLMRPVLAGLKRVVVGRRVGRP